MHDIDLLIFLAHAKCECHLVFDNQFAFLESGYGSSHFLQFLTAYAIKVFDNLIVNGLLLYYKWILGVGIEIKPFTFEATHILSGENDT